MYQVYVLSKKGKPLMPTKDFGMVKRMLKNGQAKDQLITGTGT